MSRETTAYRRRAAWWLIEGLVLVLWLATAVAAGVLAFVYIVAPWWIAVPLGLFVGWVVLGFSAVIFRPVADFVARRYADV